MAACHTVAQGECLSTIAKQYRFSDYHAIYEHPKNTQLKKKRANPNVLFPGDTFFIPDKQEKQPSRTTDQRHIFEVTMPTIMLRVKLLEEEEKPFGNQRYELKVGDKVIPGTTTPEGMVEQKIPIDATEAEITLCLEDNGVQEMLTVPLAIGYLAPIDELKGVQARLNNLGYACGPIDGIFGDLTKAAVERFQKAHQLDVDGIPGPQTQAKLKEIYGC